MSPVGKDSGERRHHEEKPDQVQAIDDRYSKTNITSPDPSQSFRLTERSIPDGNEADQLKDAQHKSGGKKFEWHVEATDQEAGWLRSTAGAGCVSPSFALK